MGFNPVDLAFGNMDALYASNERLKAENAKLREQIHWLKQGDILHVLTDQEYIDQCEREHLMQVSIDALDKENAKLRELMRNLRRVIPADVVGVVIGANTDHPTYYKFDEAFRELGVEVDE